MKIFSIFLVLVLCGCANISGNKSDGEIVAERTQAWLDALLDKKIKKAWEFTSPAYRANNNSDAYFKNIAGSASWTDAHVESVKCDGDKCDVTYMITYSLPRFKVTNTRPLQNVWIKVDGKWWLYQK